MTTRKEPTPNASTKGSLTLPENAIEVDQPKSGIGYVLGTNKPIKRK
jgi:hypothetical protein